MKRVIVVGTLMLSAAVVVLGQGQNASATLDAVTTAMGASNPTSLYFAGRGSMFNFGQAVSASAAWPQQVLKFYSADIQLTTPAMRVQAYRTNPDGSAPFGGFLQMQWVSGNDAWNTASFEDAPAPPPPPGAAPAGGGGGGRAGGAPPAGGPPAGGPP